jgi:glycosyltransferase involved in cell wall biosynthesis
VKRPLVSVVIPVYNAASTIEATLQSVLAQDYEPFEVIVVDDESTDASAEIVKSHPEVRYLRQRNGGPNVARNTGVDAAAGEFIAFVDADDVVPPNKLSIQVGYLVEHPEIPCVLGRQHWVDPPANLARDVVWGDLDGIPIMSAVIRRSTLLEVGGMAPEERGPDGRYVAMDLELFIRLRERGIPFVVLPDVVLERGFSAGNLVAGRELPPIPIRALKAKLDRERNRQS